MKIGVIGLAGAGKDTAAEAFGLPVVRLAAPLKDAARALFGPTFDDRDVKEKAVLVRTVDLITACERCADMLDLREPSKLAQLVCKTFPVTFDSLYISPREFQQRLGTDVIREIQPAAFRQYIAMLDCDLVCPDVRFQDEAAMFDWLLCIVRPGVAPVANHQSENMAREFTAQYQRDRMATCGRLIWIENDSSIAALQSKVRTVYAWLRECAR